MFLGYQNINLVLQVKMTKLQPQVEEARQEVEKVKGNQPQVKEEKTVLDQFRGFMDCQVKNVVSFDIVK